MSDRSQTARFRELHGAGRPLILPNAGDAGSARVIEATGGAAIVQNLKRLARALRPAAPGTADACFA